jgi:hypothetical protein
MLQQLKKESGAHAGAAFIRFRMLGFRGVRFVKLRRQAADLAARRVAMQLALARGLVERGNSGAQFFLRHGGIGSNDRFGCNFDGGADLGPGCAVMFAALEVLPLTLFC